MTNLHGGIKVYRGSAKAARNYVEADRPRADDYYLAEGTGLAEHYVATAGADGPSVRVESPLGGDAYEAWVAGLDRTGQAKGRVRTDDQAVRFVEVVVNGPKTWSLAAAVHPEIAAAYEKAQDRAVGEIISWLAANATTRVGPRGRQVQVPVERIEAATIRHYTSRAGDPHRHLHLQINARVWAAGKWRGIHTVGVRDSLEAINGIGHAAVQCDPRFRQVLAGLGYTLDVESGEIRELAPFVGEFSDRAAQIDRNVSRYEAEWRTEHPGQEPGPRLRQAWDTRAWAQARPDKVVPKDGTDLVRRWIDELQELGFHEPAAPDDEERGLLVPGSRVGLVDRDDVVDTALIRLGARRSAWNAADIRGQVEQAIAAADLVTNPSIRRELAEDLTARAIEACVPLLGRSDVPGHVRALTSPRVLAVEADLTARLANRAAPAARTGEAALVRDESQVLDPMQRDVVTVLAAGGDLVVIEGAAGAGKTTTLAVARDVLDGRGHRLVVVTPTLKASQVAARELQTPAFSAAWLVHQYGFCWDDDGRWTRDICPDGTVAPPAASAALAPGDVLLVDEAGMLDQDTAQALLQVADETGARVAFMGDRHQLPAVGRGGVLDLATRWATPEACVTLDAVHRFADAEYAELSLLMRSGERSGEVFDRLHARGEIQLHATEVEQNHALTTLTTSGPDSAHKPGGEDLLLVADTRAQVDLLNKTIRDRRLTTGQVDDTDALGTAAGGRLGVGDRVMTRLNDRDLDVANRESWTITQVSDNGAVTVTGRNGDRNLPADYARRHLALAYATTAYGAQGETVAEAHLAISDSTDAASAYVAMTRGRAANTAHLVAETVEDARRTWIEVFSCDRADLGPAHAATLAADDIDRYGPTPPDPTPGTAALLQAAILRQHHEQTGTVAARDPRRQANEDTSRRRGVGR